MTIEVWHLIVGLVLAALPGVLALGGGWVRLARVESDVKGCLPRDVYIAEQAGVRQHLERIERDTTRILNRLDGEVTGKFPRSPT